MACPLIPKPSSRRVSCLGVCDQGVRGSVRGGAHRAAPTNSTRSEQVVDVAYAYTVFPPHSYAVRCFYRRSDKDWTQWNPWRAPGAAPVYDSCGMAGGSPEWTATQLSFIDTKNAKQVSLSHAAPAC
jgi:hypothetical protein